jgi:hypothetical protein
MVPNSGQANMSRFEVLYNIVFNRMAKSLAHFAFNSWIREHPRKRLYAALCVQNAEQMPLLFMYQNSSTQIEIPIVRYVRRGSKSYDS